MLLKTTDDGTQIADFEFGFTLDGKAVVTEGDDGAVYIEGLASDFDIDRQDEAFEPGAFDAGLKAYMDTNPILLYHHKSDTALGQVVEYNLKPEGLHVKARVDAPEPGTMIADYVRKIKNGTLRAFSVGGKFYRHMTEKGPRIFKCDIGEVSVTPYPVNPRTLFAVAGKAFEPGETTPVSVEDVTMSEFASHLEAIDRVLNAAAESHEGKAKKNGGPSGALASGSNLGGSSGSGGGGGRSGSGSSGAGSTSPQVARARTPIGQGHPDRGAVAGLLMHMQKVHTLATDVHQNATDPEVQDVAAKAVKDAAKHTSALHHIAARIGPLPDYYGGLA